MYAVSLLSCLCVRMRFFFDLRTATWADGSMSAMFDVYMLSINTRDSHSVQCKQQPTAECKCVNYENCSAVRFLYANYCDDRSSFVCYVCAYIDGDWHYYRRRRAPQIETIAVMSIPSCVRTLVICASSTAHSPLEIWALKRFNWVI